jgi:hypothetical protein
LPVLVAADGGGEGRDEDGDVDRAKAARQVVPGAGREARHVVRVPVAVHERADVVVPLGDIDDPVVSVHGVEGVVQVAERPARHLVGHRHDA